MKIYGGLLLILISIVVPSWVVYDQNRRNALARADLRAMISASERFFLDYGYWPSPHTGVLDDMRYGREIGNDAVMNILRAEDGIGNEAHRNNPNRIVYIRIPPRTRGNSGLNERGDFLDPWGTPYQMVLDTDLNNMCQMTQSIYPNQVGVGIVVWSCGSDRRSDTPKDILSWRK